MDHRDALEQLELAAIEPGGLDRLMAGDTPTAAAVAGHVAGCAVCATELERLRRSVPLIRDVIRTTPPEDLRARTLAFVRERGEPRSAAVGSVEPAMSPEVRGTAAGGVDVQDSVDAGDRVGPLDDAAASTAASASTAPAAPRLGGRAGGALGWVAAVAAAVVISVTVTALLMDQRLDDQERQIAGLSAVTEGTLRVTGEPDAERVALVATDGSESEGTLIFSPTTTELVVVATGLTEPPSGLEYRCWVQVGGERRSIGKMFFGGGLAYWVGPASVASLPDDAAFGVSLMDVASDDPVSPDPVMTGEL